MKVEIPIELLMAFMDKSEEVALTMYDTLGNDVGYLNKPGDGAEEACNLYEDWRSTEHEILAILDAYGLKVGCNRPSDLSW